MKKITVLCTTENSIYKKLGMDCYDKNRDAYSYKGKGPVIAHPPCAQWSRLKKFAKKDTMSKLLLHHCMQIVRTNGGVVEHPAGSELIKYYNLKIGMNVQASKEV